MTDAIKREDRHTLNHPCAVCGGHDGLAHEKDGRCFGFTLGAYVHCTQSAYAGQLERIETSGTFAHWLGGPCKCGLPHDKQLRSERPSNGEAITKKFLREIRYRLCNKAGEWIASHIRREYQNAPKDFSWILPDKNTEGLFGIKKETLPLYGSERLIGLPTDALVIVTEGEKKCDALVEHLYLSVATVTGANGEVSKESLACLIGHSIYLWPDNDPKGRAHMDRIAATLKSLGASCKIIAWTDAEEKEDAADFFRKGGTSEGVRHLLDHAEEWVPPLLFADPESAASLHKREIAPLEYAVWPLCSLGNVTMLQGEPKAGKSSISLYLAISAACGIWVSGRFSVPKPRRVLFVAYEDGDLRLQKNLRLYLAGLGCDVAPPSLDIYSHRTAPEIRLEKPEGVARLRWLLDRHRYEFAIFDTFSHLHGVEENSKKEMQPVLDALKNAARDFSCSILFNHHTAKAKEGKSAIYLGRGTSAIAAAVDTLINWGDRGESNTTPCSLHSKDDDQDKWNTVWDNTQDGKIIWRIEDAETGDSQTKICGKLVETLTEFSKTTQEGIKRSTLVDATGISYMGIKRGLDLLVLSGQVSAEEGKNRSKLYRIKSTK